MLNLSAKLKNSYLLAQESPAMLKSKSMFEKTAKRAEIKPERPLMAKSHSLGSADDTESQSKRMMATKIEKYNHLLVGKVKDSQIMFAFFVEASVIEVDPNNASFGM